MERLDRYNKKAFLAPDSIDSMAAYHAKIKSDGVYLFRIHDCLTSVRLHGDLTDPVQVKEAVEKLMNLSRAALDFAQFICINYQTNTPE